MKSNNSIGDWAMGMMVKMLLVLMAGLFLTSQFTGMSLKEIKEHGGAVKAIQYTIEQETNEAVNGFLDELMSF